MARKTRYGERELAEAAALVKSAKTLRQLRQGQAVLLPALLGASIETTAQILGIGRNRVYVLRRQFRTANAATENGYAQRGGRRRQLMTMSEETAFLKPWVDRARGTGEVTVAPLLAAFEERVGKKVAHSTLYRMLARHGLRPARPGGRVDESGRSSQLAAKKKPAADPAERPHQVVQRALSGDRMEPAPLRASPVAAGSGPAIAPSVLLRPLAPIVVESRIVSI